MAVTAYVLVQTKPGTSHEVLGSRKIRGVTMASSVFGRYDAVLVITAENMDELSKTVYDVVEKHPNVEHTECLVSIPYPPEEEVQPPVETQSVSAFSCPSCNTLNEQGSVFCRSCGFIFKPAKKKPKSKR